MTSLDDVPDRRVLLAWLNEYERLCGELRSRSAEQQQAAQLICQAYRDLATWAGYLEERAAAAESVLDYLRHRHRRWRVD